MSNFYVFLNCQNLPCFLWSFKDRFSAPELLTDFLQFRIQVSSASKHSLLQTFWKFFFYATFVLQKISIYSQKKSWILCLCINLISRIFQSSACRFIHLIGTWFQKRFWLILISSYHVLVLNFENFPCFNNFLRFAVFLFKKKSTDS